MCILTLPGLPTFLHKTIIRAFLVHVGVLQYMGSISVCISERDLSEYDAADGTMTTQGWAAT